MYPLQFIINPPLEVTASKYSILELGNFEPKNSLGPFFYN